MSAGSGGRPTSGKHASSPLGDWRAKASWTIGIALAPSSRWSYASMGRDFILFHKSEGLNDTWLIPVPQLMPFNVHHKSKWLAVHSIRGKLATLAFVSKASGFIECTGIFRLVKMLDGWAREDCKPVDDREPFPPTALSGL